MPWACNSLGTVEYTQDIWSQITSVPPRLDAPSDKVVSHASNIYADARNSGSIVAKCYLDKFDVRTSLRAKGNDRRLLPVSKHNEYDEPLPTEAALDCWPG